VTLPLGKPIRLTVLSDPAHLPLVRCMVERVCEMAGFDAAGAHRIMLSVDEAMTNIIRHAYDGDTHQPIDVEFSIEAHDDGCECLRIRLRDYGRREDPARIRSRDLQDVRPGGLGVHIIKECMDSVQYEPAEGGGTALTLMKSIPGKEQMTS